MSQKIQNYIFIISGVIAVLSAIAYMLSKELAVYTFALGAAGMISIRIKNLSHSNDFRIRRLQKIQALSTILLLGTVYLMYIHHNAWVVTLTLSAGIDLIVSFRTPKDEK